MQRRWHNGGSKPRERSQTSVNGKGRRARKIGSNPPEGGEGESPGTQQRSEDGALKRKIARRRWKSEKERSGERDG